MASALAAILAMTIVGWALFVDRERHNLLWKLRPGEQLRYRTVMESGASGVLKVQVSESRYTVESVSPEGIAELTELLERTTIREGGLEGRVLWDSSSGAPAPKDVDTALSVAMLGVAIRYCVDARGNILSADGFDVVKKRYRDIMGGDLFGMSDLAFSGTRQTLLGGNLPEGPARRGARWTYEGSFGNEAWGKRRSAQTYALHDVRKGVATIVQVASEERGRTPGEIPKALNLSDAPDPKAAHGIEDTSTFSIPEGILLSSRNHVWTQATLSNGKLFRFEFTSETTLVERQGP